MILCRNLLQPARMAGQQRVEIAGDDSEARAALRDGESSLGRQDFGSCVQLSI